MVVDDLLRAATDKMKDGGSTLIVVNSSIVSGNTDTEVTATIGQQKEDESIISELARIYAKMDAPHKVDLLKKAILYELEYDAENERRNKAAGSVPLGAMMK